MTVIISNLLIRKIMFLPANKYFKGMRVVINVTYGADGVNVNSDIDVNAEKSPRKTLLCGLERCYYWFSLLLRQPDPFPVSPLCCQKKGRPNSCFFFGNLPSSAELVRHSGSLYVVVCTLDSKQSAWVSVSIIICVLYAHFC